VGRDWDRDSSPLLELIIDESTGEAKMRVGWKVTIVRIEMERPLSDKTLTFMVLILSENVTVIGLDWNGQIEFFLYTTNIGKRTSVRW